MAVIRRIQAERGLATGSRPSTRVDDSVGRAAQGLARSIQSTGSTLARASLARQEQNQNFDLANRQLDQANTLAQRDLDQDMQLRRERNAMELEGFRQQQEFKRFVADSGEFVNTSSNEYLDPTGAGFTESISKGFNDRAEKFLGTVPPAFKPKFQELVQTARAATMDKAAEIQNGKRLKYTEQELTNSKNAAASTVIQNPNTYDGMLEAGLAEIDAAPGISGTVKSQLKQQYTDVLKGARAEHYVRTNPSALTGGRQVLGPGASGVVSAGKGFTTIRMSDGRTVRRTGTRAWRNNNPGNIEAGNFADSHGSVGSDGRFAVFPNYEAGRRAKAALIFDSPSYRNRSILGVINRYAPPFENDTNRYASEVAKAVGGNLNTPVSSLSAAQREQMLDAMERVEGFRAGSESVTSGGSGNDRAASSNDNSLPLVFSRDSARQGIARTDEVVVSRFRQLQNTLGIQIPIRNSFRDPEHNARVGGAKKSQHLHGRALDLDVGPLSKDQRLEIIRTASALGFTGIGVYNNTIHLDTGPRRAWGPSYSGDSVPSWAKAAIGEHMSGNAQPTAAQGGRTGNAGGVYLSPMTEGLPLKQRLAIYDRAVSASQGAAREQAAQEKASYADHFGSVKLNIETGGITSEGQILNDDILDDGDKTTALKAFRAKNKQDVDVNQLFQDLTANDGSAARNVFDSNDRGTVDKAFEKAIETIPEERREGFASEVIRQTGIVPAPVVADIRQGLNSGNVEQVQRSLNTASNIEGVQRGALSQRTGGGEIEKDVVIYEGALRRGEGSEAAARRVIDMRDPERKAARKVVLNDKETKAWLEKTSSEQSLIDEFDQFTGPGGNPEIGAGPQQRAAILGDYRIMLEDAMLETDDMDMAKDLALSRFRKLYGVSTLNVQGERVLMRNPPERAYPEINGSHDYLRKALKKDMKALGIEAEDVFLAADVQTDRAIVSNQPAPYRVIYRKPTGEFETLPNPFFLETDEVTKYRDADVSRRRSEIMCRQQEFDDAASAFGAQNDAGEQAFQDTIGTDAQRARARENAILREQMEQESTPAIPAQPEADLGDLSGEAQRLRGFR